MREGDQFGPYQLEERLAVGGMAEIFRARRLGVAGFARQVCIKRVLPAFCSDRAFVEMFIDEARTGAQLRHGNIVAIEDFGEVDGQYYLCMELVSGTDLARLLHRLAQDARACPVNVATYIAMEVLEALDYAHRKRGDDGAPLGVVHRDVSPQNVLLSFAGEVKLTDFGIAKAASRLHQTVGQVVKGKIAYMAPEQARGVKLDGRADLFAVGVVLFETLAGRRPFAGTSETEVVMALVRGQRPRLSELRPDVPPALEDVVDRLLAIDPGARFASASEALDALSRVPSDGAAPRTLAAMLAHYFPGHASAVRRAEPFAPESLPPAPGAPAAHDVARAPTEPATPPARPLPAEPTLVTPVEPIEPLASTDPDAPPLAATMVDAAPLATGERTIVDAAPVPGSGTVVAPAPIAPTDVARPPPTAERTALAPLAVEPARETSPHATTRTMVAPVTSGTAPPEAPAAVTAPARPAPTRAATIAALVLLLGVLATWLALRPERPSPRPAPTPTATPPGTIDAAAPVPNLLPASPVPLSVPPTRAEPARGDGSLPPPTTALVPAAPPDAAAPAAPGTLVVRVAPWARVAIDGRARGTTPVTVTVTPGVHTVQLTWPPGHVTRTKSVYVAPGSRTVINEDLRR